MREARRSPVMSRFREDRSERGSDLSGMPAVPITRVALTTPGARAMVLQGALEQGSRAGAAAHGMKLSASCAARRVEAPNR